MDIAQKGYGLGPQSPKNYLRMGMGLYVEEGRRSFKGGVKIAGTKGYKGTHATHWIPPGVPGEGTGPCQTHPSQTHLT